MSDTFRSGRSGWTNGRTPCTARLRQGALARFALAACAALAVVGVSAAAAEHPGSRWVTQLIDRHVAAIGGAPLLERIQTGRVQLQGQQGARVFLLDLLYRADGRLTFSVSSPQGLEARQVRDAQGDWWRQDERGGRKIQDEKQRLELLEMTIGLETSCWRRLNEVLVDYGFGGRETLDGRDVDVLHALSRRGGQTRLYFDRASGLLVRVGQTTLGDYRDVGGVRLPHRIRQGSDFLLQLKPGSVSFNPPLEDPLFAPPPSIALLAHHAEAGTAVFVSSELVDLGKQWARRPAAPPWLRLPLLEWPQAPASGAGVSPLALGGLDLRGLDLTAQGSALRQADFDTGTLWPDRLPADFHPAQLLETARNPGLGLRRVHAEGLTGRGVGVALIAPPPRVEHAEYRDRLRFYEEIHVLRDAPATPAGTALAALIAGRTVGVAPGADLYCVGVMPSLAQGNRPAEVDPALLAKAIERLLAIHRSLPATNKLRVLCLASGLAPKGRFSPELERALANARSAGLYPLIAGASSELAWRVEGLTCLGDPDRVEAYRLAAGGESSAAQASDSAAPRLLVPVEPRAVAHPSATNAYALRCRGDNDAPAAFLAGLYALACQTKPSVTPEEFRAAALRSGTAVSPAGGRIVNPTALLGALRTP